MEAQLELVQLYCDGSGAKLNLNKCVVLPLNRRRHVPQLGAVRVLERGETVKYLGIPFGQASVVQALLDDLDRKFYEGFKLWFRRARTLQDRLLIAQTMVLSRLWHYTMHVCVPEPVIRRWQATLHRFVLSRRYGRDARHVQLISSAFVAQPRSVGGLQVPSIDAAIKRQMLSLVLQFIRESDASVCNWTSAGHRVLERVLPRWGPRQPFDFLAVNPKRHGKILDRSCISQWWREAWLLWHRTRFPVTWLDLPGPTRLAYALLQPLWFHGDSTFQYERPTRPGSTTAHRRSLSMVAEPQRSFRRHITQAFGLRCLSDFLDTSGAWPAAVDFARRHIDYMWVGVRPYQQYQWLQRLHVEATQVFRRVMSVCGASEDDLRVVGTAPPSPYAGVRIQTRVCLVPNVPRSQLLRLVWQAPTTVRPHPIQLHDPSATPEDIKTVVRRRKRLRKLLLPVFEDLQFRLAFRLLPVRSRFSWNQELIYCLHPGCVAVETERHLFFECVLASQVWLVVFRDWSVFFEARPTWLHIVLGGLPCVVSQWTGVSTVIEDLWQVLRSVTLHSLWRWRNELIFCDRAPPPLIPALRVVYTTFTAHVRACRRRLYTDEEQTQLQLVLEALRGTRSLGAFIRSNKRLLQVRYLA